jgi:N-acetylmuramoyl-L-alanine amidase
MDHEKTPSDLLGRKIAIVVGHEPGGGAQDERSYNKRVAAEMHKILTNAGAKPIVFEHRFAAYGLRQNDTMNRIAEAMGTPFIVIELHFDAVENPKTKGHHFQYLGAKRLAEAIRDRYEDYLKDTQAPYDSPRRFDDGIYRNTRGNGSGFLRKSTGWACLVEPFFRSHPPSWIYWKDKAEDLARIYCMGLNDFAGVHKPF